MVAERRIKGNRANSSCSLAKISMVAELYVVKLINGISCSLAKISMVAELSSLLRLYFSCCSLAKISMVAEPQNI